MRTRWSVRWILGLVLALLLGCCGGRALAASYGQSWLDVDYVGDGIVGHRLDIYTPAAGSGPFPVLIVLYGSAWARDDRKGPTGAVSANVWCPLGFAIVSINHRSSHDVPFPAQIHDVKAAIRFVRANADVYSLDPNRIGLSGGSSGAHLAALAGTSGDVGEYTILEETIDLEGNLGPYVGTSSRVHAVCTMASPTDFLMKDACDPEVSLAPEEALIGGPLLDNVALCGFANPITYVDPSDPPFRMFHGSEDLAVPHCQSAALRNALLMAGVPVEYTLVEGAGHGNLGTVEVSMQILEFFQDVLGKS